VEATLYLALGGDYFYLAVPGNDAEHVYEQGFYSVNGTKITFSSADGLDSFEGYSGGQYHHGAVCGVQVMGMRVEIDLTR